MHNDELEKLERLSKTAMPHVETVHGDFLDLTLEKLKPEERINYLERFVAGKFRIKGIHFNDIIEDDAARVLYYLHSLKQNDN